MLIPHGPVDPVADPWPAVGPADDVDGHSGEQGQAHKGAHCLPGSCGNTVHNHYRRLRANRTEQCDAFNIESLSSARY